MAQKAELAKAWWRRAAGTVLELLMRYKTTIIFGAFLATMPLWTKPATRAIKIDLLTTMVQVGIFAVAAVGLNLLMGYAGQVSLGQGAFFGIGAYTSALLTTKAGFPVWLGIAAAVLVAALIGFLVAPVLRLKGHYLALATLGLAIVTFVLIREMAWLTGGNNGVTSIPSLPWPGPKDISTRGEFYVVWSLALVVLVFCANLVRSRFGRSLRALHQSEVAAEAMGVNVAGQKIKVFVLSAALGGLAGGFFAHVKGFIDPNLFTFSLSISIVTMVVVGGMESVWGAVAGAAVIQFIPKVIEAIPKWVPEAPRWVERYSSYEGIIFGLILVMTMIFMPAGITRGLSDMVRYRRSPFVNPFRKSVVE